MSGVPTHNHNRFGELASPKRKYNRKRIRADEFVNLVNDTEVDDEHMPRFLIASTLPPKDVTKHIPLASHNIFQIGRGIDHISTNYQEITAMASGDLLIKTNDKKTADKFLTATHIDCVPVKIVLHSSLNSSQGKVYCEHISQLSEEEIIKYVPLVIGVRKIMKKDGDKMVPTGAAILTFNCIKRPKKVQIGWRKITVKEYTYPESIEMC